MGFTVFVWSTSGRHWAETVVNHIGLDFCVDYVLSKPHRVFDDVVNLGDTIKHGYIKL
jgi:hypothetical protein